MKRCNLDCNFWLEFDLFAKEPELYYKGKSQRTSVFGKIFTYFYTLLYVGFFIYKIVRMLEKSDITFFETYAYSGVPSIKLNNHLFYGGFSLGGIIEETIYFPVALFYEGHREGGVMVWDEPYKQLELEKCQLEKFGKEFQEIFKDKDLSNKYCVKNVEEITLEGYSHLESFKYVSVYFYPCIGYTPDGRKCQDTSILEQFFQQNTVNFIIQDIELTPHIYDHPSQPKEKDINGPVFKTLYQQILTYMQIVILETDQDVVGFEGLSDIDTKQFLKYEESWITVSPSPHTLEFQPFTPISEVTIQLSAKVLTQKRKNTKLIEVLGDVGGLMEVVWSFLNIIATLVTDILYDKAIVNNLFSFDLDKKVIYIKNKERKVQGCNMSESPQIYSPNIPTTKFQVQSSFKMQDDLTVKSRNKLQDDTNQKSAADNKLVTKKKKKMKIKKKSTSKDPITSAVSLKNQISQNLEEGELKSPNEIYNNKDKNEGFNYNLDSAMPSEIKENNEIYMNDNKRVINRIKMKCCCVYFWFCFSRKKKNIENTLIDEGMNIVMENLDIINLFKKIHNVELIEQNLKGNGNIIEMSDICKHKIYALDKIAFKK